MKRAMRFGALLLLFGAAAALVLLGKPATAADQPTAKEIVAKSDDLMRGRSSVAEMKMKITTPRFQRELQIKAWTEGRDKAFIAIMAPAKDAGVTFLKLNREMWNYIPTIERTVKIPPSMMSQNWMGSDFTNNDLSRADSLIVDYEPRLLGEETMGGDACWKIELDAKPDAPVVWPRIVGWIAKDTYIMRKAEYYDDDGQVAREMLADKIVTVSGRKIASHMTIINRKKTGQQTEMTFDKMQFDVTISADTFSERNLTRGIH